MRCRKNGVSSVRGEGVIGRIRAGSGTLIWQTAVGFQGSRVGSAVSIRLGGPGGAVGKARSG